MKKYLIFAFLSANLWATPQAITINAKYVHLSEPMIMVDRPGVTIAIFAASLEVTSYSADPRDILDLAHAASKEFIRPLLNSCQLSDYSFDYIGMGSQILNFGARDTHGSKDCQNFMRAASESLEMKFTDVPLLNRGAVIPTVTVQITR